LLGIKRSLERIGYIIKLKKYKLKKKFLIGISILLINLQAVVLAQNPILVGWADPATQVWDGKMYMAVGKDRTPGLKHFEMTQWAIYSSEDLMNWKLETDILPEQTYLGEGYEGCWASDITKKDDKFYFYFSNKNTATGVLVSEKADGQYMDVLQKPLVPADLTINNEYDPTVFTDDDGQRYLIMGRDGMRGKDLVHYQIARLHEDMVSLAEMPRDIITDRKYGFGTERTAPDHSYFHKYQDIYYLSLGSTYATSKNIYGPYTNFRNAGLGLNHSSFTEFNGQWYHAYNTFVDPRDPRYRQVEFTYLHYKDNGDMIDDMDFAVGGKHYDTGVGNYNVEWDTIEGEWFFRKSAEVLKKENHHAGFELQNLRNNSYVNFPNIKEIPVNSSINFKVASTVDRAKIEVHQGSPSGEILGSCNIPNTGSFTEYKVASCKLKNTSGVKDLYFVVKGSKDQELLRLDWFNFSN